MESNGFQSFLREKNIGKETIEDTLKILGDLQTLLEENNVSIDHLSYEDVYNLAEMLIEKKQNTYDCFVALYRWGHYQSNKDVLIATLEMLDGGEMMKNFSRRLEAEFSKQFRDEVFEGIGIPPLGIRPAEKVPYTKQLVNRFLEKVEYEEGVRFFEEGLRDKYTASYKKPKDLFDRVKNIDIFLKLRHENFLNTLKKHMGNNTLFFTQEIDEKVVSYVKKDQRIGTGIRKGDRVFITKIPYLAKNFLQESDPKLRRFYYCHNPWIRDALRTEDQPIDPAFCGCSAGFFKNFWEAMLNQPVRVEVLKSFIKGDDVCEFVLHLPAKVVAPFSKVK